MRLVESVRRGRWSTVFGYGRFVALMVAGYYYNITFVQLGLIDLGTRFVGLSETAVSVWMAALALVVAVATGILVDSRGWSTDLRTKLELLLAVVCVQFALTVVAPHVRSVPSSWAVVNTSFGLARFEPAWIPDGGGQ